MKQSPVIQKKMSSIKKILLWSIPILLFAVVILGLTHDIIITNYHAHQICKADTSTKTFITKTVEYPESVYWEDNIYPGFNEEERLLMIRNYLDGVHLKTMALNGPNGNVHLYTATEMAWQKSRDVVIKTEQDVYDYHKILNDETKAIEAQGKVFIRNDLPQLNYSVVFNPVPLSSDQNRYLYSDEVVITENNSKEVIAYNRRLMRYYYKFELEPIGGCKCLTSLNSNSIYGLPNLYEIDDQVISSYLTFNTHLKNFKCKRSYQNKL